MSRRSVFPFVLAGGLLLGTVLMVLRPWDSGPSEASRTARNPNRELARPTRPTEPPVPGRDHPRPAPSPQEPPGMAELRASTYEQAKEQGSERPGDKAFRATVDAFLEYNKAFAESQAAAEGITVDEVRELTYFGFMVLETQRWPEVESILGRELSAEERELGEELMHRYNSEFKTGMRDLVSEDADVEERWKLIRATEERYKQEYFALTGMQPEELDDLLAGDITRTGAPIATPPPTDIPTNPDTPTAPPTRPDNNTPR